MTIDVVETINAVDGRFTDSLFSFLFFPVADDALVHHSSIALQVMSL